MKRSRSPSANGAARTRAHACAGLASLAIAVTVVMAAWSPSLADEPTTQTRAPYVELGLGRRPAAITLTLGKSENVHTDKGAVSVIVSDQEIADVIPLTDHSLSVLGKKIGSTRVSVYGENKVLVGVFDVEVTYDTSKLAGELASRFPTSRFKVSSVNGRIMLSGTTPDAATLDQAVIMARQFGPDVINSVRVTSPQQVMLEVRFIEASRTASRELGIKWNIVAKNLTANLGTAALISGNAPFGVIIAKLIGNGVEVDPMINALEERGLARRLAEPNLVALSGDTASFLAGGEFPFPVSSNLGQVSVEFKRFGVGLSFTPTVLDNGLINLKIAPEVSQLDPNNVVVVNGVRIPSLIVRRANTTVELRDGQSFAIAGLLQSISTTDQQQFPWLGDVPVLGALLRSASYQKQETDLAIIVTVRLVRPTRPGDTVRTPLDNTAPANDADFFLLGRGELTRTQTRDAVGPGADARPVGHILDLPGRTSDAAQ